MGRYAINTAVAPTDLFLPPLRFTLAALVLLFGTPPAAADVTPTGDSHRVEAVAGDAVDRSILASWSRMKDLLRAGDVSSAVTFIVRDKRETYRRAFEALTIPLHDIDKALGDIRFVTERGPYREYEMTRVKDGTTYSFAVIFVLEPDGVWRLSSF